jgi:hypothetical protein
MKHYQLLGWLSAGFLISTPFLSATAADDAPVAAQTQTQVVIPVAAPRLSYGVEDILKLTRAQISDDVIATYIQSSGTIYNLHPSDIVQLHSQGVSDHIITLMLSQGRITAEPTNQPASIMPVLPVATVATAPIQPTSTDQPLFIPGQNAAEMAAPNTPVVEEAPSTLYVIPYYGSFGYRPTYSVYGGCYTAYGCAPTYAVRLGGHRFHSFRHH